MSPFKLTTAIGFHSFTTVWFHDCGSSASGKSSSKEARGCYSLMSGSSKITRFALAPGVRCLKANRFHFSRKLDLTDRGVFPSSARAQFKASEQKVGKFTRSTESQQQQDRIWLWGLKVEAWAVKREAPRCAFSKFADWREDCCGPAFKNSTRRCYPMSKWPAFTLCLLLILPCRPLPRPHSHSNGELPHCSEQESHQISRAREKSTRWSDLTTGQSVDDFVRPAEMRRLDKWDNTHLIIPIFIFTQIFWAHLFLEDSVNGNR